MTGFSSPLFSKCWTHFKSLFSSVPVTKNTATIDYNVDAIKNIVTPTMVLQRHVVCIEFCILLCSTDILSAAIQVPLFFCHVWVFYSFLLSTLTSDIYILLPAHAEEFTLPASILVCLYEPLDFLLPVPFKNRFVVYSRLLRFLYCSIMA